MAFEIFLQTTIDSLSPRHPTLSFSALGEGQKSESACGEAQAEEDWGKKPRARMDKDEAYP
jgi:hypothetical protein